MYGKIFESMYHGSLHGDWQTMIVFQQLIVLADSEGVVDITPAAISSITSIPIDIIEPALVKLSEPDPMSRSPGDNGRRIVLLDDHRDWGWQIVNHKHYRDLTSREDQRRKEREKKRKQRENAKTSDPKKDVSPLVPSCPPKSRHTDTDTDTDADADAKNSVASATCSFFDEFWEHTPRKVGKQAAKKAFAKACKIQTARHIIDKMAEFAKSDKAKGEFCPHPATWLNEGRYDDDPECWRVETLEQRNKRFAAEWLERNPG